MSDPRRSRRLASATPTTAALSPSSPPPARLLDLPTDLLDRVVDGIADPLEPAAAVALSSSCKGLRALLRAVLERLRRQHNEATEFCHRAVFLGEGGEGAGDRRALERNRASSWLQNTLELSLDPEVVWEDVDGLCVERLNTQDITTLAMILRTNGLPRLQRLYLGKNLFNDEAMITLCGALRAGTMPSLTNFAIFNNRFGPSAADALAAALSRGAMPNLDTFAVYNNPIGNQGLAALKAPLRKRELWFLAFLDTGIDDEGVSSLMHDLVEDDFPSLGKLNFGRNSLTDRSCDAITAAISRGAMPALFRLEIPASFGEAAEQCLSEAIARPFVKTRFSHPELFPAHS